jgi:hypothetical protein
MALCPGSSDTRRVGAAASRLGVPAIAVALAVVLLAGVVVAALRPGTASAATVLQRGEGVVVQADDGSSRPLRVGDEVPRGSVVVAAADGAVLATRGRDTWLGGGAAVAVLDGARQDLRAGLVMVDARRGPGLLLSTPAADVRTPEGAVSRVEGGPLLRVGAYDGDPLTVQPAGRSATTPVARAYQVQVPEGSLPGRVTPLVLTPDDPYERALAPVLVAGDEALTDVAERLDAEGAPAVAVRAAADADVPLAAVPAAVPAGAPGSERALAYLLARAAGGAAGEGLADRYAEVRALRGDGGSWGVVASLVQAEVTAVAALLDELLAPGAALQAAQPLDVPTLLDLVGGGPAPAPAPAPTATAPTPAPPAAPGPPPAAPSTPPSPAPPSAPVPEPPPVVGEVVDTVLGLLTAPAPAAPTGPSATGPAPSPTPAPLLPPLPLPLPLPLP